MPQVNLVSSVLSCCLPLLGLCLPQIENVDAHVSTCNLQYEQRYNTRRTWHFTSHIDCSKSPHGSDSRANTMRKVSFAWTCGVSFAVSNMLSEKKTWLRKQLLYKYHVPVFAKLEFISRITELSCCTAQKLTRGPTLQPSPDTSRNSTSHLVHLGSKCAQFQQVLVLSSHRRTASASWAKESACSVILSSAV